MIRCKIDVTKIDKARLFKGQKGTYLDLTLIETPNDQYGNSHMIVQDVGKEDREKGIKGAILGNAKTFGKSSPAAQPPPKSDTQTTTIMNKKPENLDEDVPF